MKKKNFLMTVIAILGLATITSAQVPSYVPSNGLVGWWPFNGNANDESGNGNNGTVNGATLTNDRFGNANNAYFFNHTDEITTNFNSISGSQPRTISFWMRNQYSSKTINPIWYGGNPNQPIIAAAFNIIFNRNEQSDPCNCWPITYEGIGVSADWIYSMKSAVVGDNQWHNWIVSIENAGDNFNQIKYFKDGNLINSAILFDYNNNGTNVVNTINLNNLKFGKSSGLSNNPDRAPTEFLDDIGIWNRALTQQEITDLYIGCQLSVNTQPTNQTININNNAQFVVGSSDPSATYQWQTNGVNLGWQNIPINSTYSGVTTNTLTVNNVQLANHNQPFRVIASSGNCVDTSNISVLTISNTCTSNVTVYDTVTTNVYDTLTTNVYDTLTTNITVFDTVTITTNITIYDTITTNETIYDTLTTNITIYDTLTTNVYDTTYVTVSDTLLTTVTDTLIINTTLSLPAPNNENTILIYPNPASDHITIDNGNFGAMVGYSIKITNNTGQEVFLNAINQQQFYVDLSTWTGNGLYFVHLIDSQNNTVTVRKIVLQ